MATKRTEITRAFAVAAAMTASIAYGSSVIADDQRAEVQRLFQSGAYQQAVEAARDADEPTTYIAAQSLIKLERNDQANAELTRLRASQQPSWRSIGESAEALLANDAGRAVEQARRAVEADGGNAFAQYQLGLSASKAGDFGTAVAAFTRATELKPDFAYAHYYAALAHQRMRQLPKAAERFDSFLRLAPDAPERSAVVAILRTLK
jgi:tetratricopeptide (TPR) repeat protein